MICLAIQKCRDKPPLQDFVFSQSTFTSAAKLKAAYILQPPLQLPYLFTFFPHPCCSVPGLDKVLYMVLLLWS